MQVANSPVIADRYQLGERTGEQEQVELFDALDRALDRPVTIQMLTPQGAANEGVSRAFLRHQQIAASIHSCPLRAVYDAGVWQGRPYSVMEREKGDPPESLYRPGYPPDVPLVLRAARQAAESLQCCREAGLSDWTFAPSAVRIDTEGQACLGIVEGLGGEHSSGRTGTDGAALLALLNLMLTGESQPGATEYKAALVPGWVLALLERLGNTAGAGGALTAADFAQALASTEDAAGQPTLAYTPEVASQAGVEPVGGPEVVAPLAAATASPDAPTLPAVLVPAGRETGPLAVTQAEGAPYTPASVAALSEVNSPRRGVVPLVALLGGLLLLGLLTALLLPRIQPQDTAARAGAEASPTAALTALVAVPDVRGKTLDEAQNALGAVGLQLANGPYVNDASVPKDAVVQQDPAPGNELAAGRSVTVSLSLGPVAAPEESAQPPAVQPPAPQNPPEKAKDNDNGNGNGNGNGYGNGNGNGKAKGKDKGKKGGD